MKRDRIKQANIKAGKLEHIRWRRVSLVTPLFLGSSKNVHQKSSLASPVPALRSSALKMYGLKVSILHCKNTLLQVKVLYWIFYLSKSM